MNSGNSTFSLVDTCRIGLAAGAAVLVISSINDITSRSSPFSSWFDETSFAALQLRSDGFQKLGLGIAIGALATAGQKLDSSEENKNDNDDVRTDSSSVNKHPTMGKRWDRRTQSWVTPE